jgi:predicted nucleic acid-binding protein
MPVALLDTNAVSDLMRDQPQLQARANQHADPVVTSIIAYGEIWYGLERLPHGRRRADLEARAQAVLGRLPAEAITPQVADAYARLRTSLDALAVNLQDNDLWIAATALSLGAVLVTRDLMFSRVPSLLVEDWTV